MLRHAGFPGMMGCCIERLMNGHFFQNADALMYWELWCEVSRHLENFLALVRVSLQKVCSYWGACLHLRLTCWHHSRKCQSVRGVLVAYRDQDCILCLVGCSYSILYQKDVTLLSNHQDESKKTVLMWWRGSAFNGEP